MRATNDVRKLLAWLRRRSRARSADRRGWFQSHTREKALMLNFVEMNLSKAASE